MTEITRIAIDTSKSVFTLHGVDLEGRAVLRRNLRRRDLLPFFERLAPLEVALEACGGSHHWGAGAGSARPSRAAAAAAICQAVCQARQKRPQ
jgi:transposase